MKLISALGCLSGLLCVAAAPATQPAPQVAQQQNGPQQTVPTKIVIIPVTALGDGQLWVGPAIQQNLSNDISQIGGVSVSSVVDGVNSADTAAVLKSARSLGVDTVVCGTCQVSGNDLRITVQVIDVATSKSLGAFKLNGAVKDLFSLEDELGVKIRHLLRPPAGGSASATADDQSTNIPTTNPSNQSGGSYPNTFASGLTPVYNYADDNSGGYPTYNNGYTQPSINWGIPPEQPETWNNGSAGGGGGGGGGGKVQFSVPLAPPRPVIPPGVIDLQGHSPAPVLAPVHDKPQTASNASQAGQGN